MDGMLWQCLLCGLVAETKCQWHMRARRERDGKRDLLAKTG